MFKTVTILMLVVNLNQANYWREREDFIKQEENRMLGSSLILSPKEKYANDILMSYKWTEYDHGFVNPGIFAPGRHFFQARKDIEESKVFHFIRKMPKGAALHGHDTALVSEDYLYNLTFRNNLYACTVNKRLRLKFLDEPNRDQTCNWTLISVLRENDPTYDKFVRSQLALYVENPRETYPDINAIWTAFEDIFATVDPMVTYRPVFKEYLYQALKELYEDNVIYLELRGTLPTVYELNGTTYAPMEIARLCKETIDQFKEDHPGFIGARYIYGPVRKVDNTTVNNYMEIVQEFQRTYPDFLAGFDLIGQEDPGLPLSAFISQLKEMAAKGINFFFHAGETKWFGSNSDFNLIDAVLLGSKRIGHGFALTKHPLIMKLVKERQIAIEVCPISNQVLMLVEDIRNHPAAILIADGYPIVISNDDPSFWSSKGLSHDFYMAFMGMASRNADIKLLKQLANNSLMYSGMPEEEKERVVELWKAQWDKFIDDVVSGDVIKSC